jgi:hypothetical protein
LENLNTDDKLLIFKSFLVKPGVGFLYMLMVGLCESWCDTLKELKHNIPIHLRQINLKFQNECKFIIILFSRLNCLKLFPFRKVNTSEHIVEDMKLPEKLVRFVSGQVAYEEEGPRVIPLQGFPDEAINMASAQLVQDHLRKYQEQRILAQVSLFQPFFFCFNVKNLFLVYFINNFALLTNCIACCLYCM